MPFTAEQKASIIAVCDDFKTMAGVKELQQANKEFWEGQSRLAKKIENGDIEGWKVIDGSIQPCFTSSEKPNEN